MEWLFFLILPLVFTFILAGGSGAPSDSRALLAVVDQANSTLSASLRAALEQSSAVRIEVLSASQADDRFAQRQVPAVLVIPAGFEAQRLGQESSELELRQLPNNMDAQIAQRAVQAAVSRLGAASDIAAASVSEAEKIQPFASAQARQAYFDSALQQAQKEINQAPSRITIDKGSTPDQVEYDPRANSSAGQMLTWVFIPLLGISGMFAYERSTGTLRRLLTTPTHKSIFLAGTIASQLLLAMLQMALLIGFGGLALNLSWGRNLPALLLMMFTSGLAAAALGTALGSFVKTEGQSNGLSIMLGMLLGLLGGCWYPMEMFPQAVQTFTKIFPTTWAMQGMLDLVLRGQGLSAVLPEAGVLLGFSALFFAVGISRFRYE